jgi:hypothetical protein
MAMLELQSPLSCGAHFFHHDTEESKSPCLTHPCPLPAWHTGAFAHAQAVLCFTDLLAHAWPPLFPLMPVFAVVCLEKNKAAD